MTKAASHGQHRLGKTGPLVSPLAWGMWRFRGRDVKIARTLIETALENGVNLFDTADVYGLDNGEPFGAAESLLGQVFGEAPSLRSRMVLASKGGIELGTPYNSTTPYLVSACEASLKRMRVERLDLYQIHRPDILAHPQEIAEAFTRLREAGKIAEAGVSNYTPAQTRALMAHLSFPLASTQPELSPLVTTALDDGTLDHAVETGLTVLAWSPLAQGRLGGTGTDRRSTDVIAALDALAASKGVARSAIAYAWIMKHPSGAIPIIGSQRPERVREAVVARDVRLSRKEWYLVLTAARGAPLP